MPNKLEDRVRRYIKMKKFFMLSDALIITGISKDILLKILKKLEDEGLIVQDRDEKSIMNKSWVVLSNRDKKISLIGSKKKNIDLEFIKAIHKVAVALENGEFENRAYHEILTKSKLSKGVFAKTINVLLKLKVLKEDEKEFDIKQNRTFTIDKNLVDDLLTFHKQKKYKELQEILDYKKPLCYVAVPKDLCQVLDVIIGNEVLKRDELAVQSGLTRKRLSDWWQIIKKLGLIIDSFKESHKDRTSYIFSSKRARIVLAHINDGAYEKDKELKHLWTR
jgi:hypothetical protein